VRGRPSATPGGWALALSAAGALALLAAGWLGGHLVYGHGVGTAPRPPDINPERERST
jgi:uncharacterized membrane protein